MKQFLITIAFIILAVFLVNTFILGDEEGTMQGEANKIGVNMIEQLSNLSK